MPYIERLADHWGELCATQEIASVWADRLIGLTRMALSPDKSLRGHFYGTSACLSALYRAERYAEIVDLLQVDTIWPYQLWAVKALTAMGKKSEAIRYAESCCGPGTHEARTGLLADAAAKHAPPPRPVEHCAIAAPYAGIEHAQLVIVNVRNDAQRLAGERIVADLLRLRKDEALFNDILGLRGSRVPITAVTANLADPADPGRKKALARVRRSLRSGSS